MCGRRWQASTCTLCTHLWMHIFLYFIKLFPAFFFGKNVDFKWEANSFSGEVKLGNMKLMRLVIVTHRHGACTSVYEQHVWVAHRVSPDRQNIAYLCISICRKSCVNEMKNISENNQLRHTHIIILLQDTMTSHETSKIRLTGPVSLVVRGDLLHYIRWWTTRHCFHTSKLLCTCYTSTKMNAPEPCGERARAWVMASEPNE